MAGPECQTSLSEPTRNFGKALTLPANLQFLNYLETSFKHSKTFHLLTFPALPAANLPASSSPLVASKASSDALPLLAAGVGGDIYIYITYVSVYIYIIIYYNI